MSDQPTPSAPASRSPKRSPARTPARVLVSAAVVAAIYLVALPRVADFSAVGRHIAAMTAPQVALLAVAAVWNLLTYGFVIVAASPGLTLGQSMVMTQSSTAVANSMPGGAALGIAMTYAMYSSWGFSRSRATLAILVSGIWNNFAKLGLPVLALALLALSGDTSPGRVVTGLAGIGTLVGAVGVFALALRSEDKARRVGEMAGRAVTPLRRLLHRPPAAGWGDATAKFRSRTTGLLSRAWLQLTVATLVSHLSLYVVLLLSLRGVGVSERDVGWVEILAAFAFVRLVSALPITPGGLGVVELGLTAALVAAGGERAPVVAGVLVFRALTYLLPIPVGTLSWLVWRRKASWRIPREDSAPAPAPAVDG